MQQCDTLFDARLRFRRTARREIYFSKVLRGRGRRFVLGTCCKNLRRAGKTQNKSSCDPTYLSHVVFPLVSLRDSNSVPLLTPAIFSTALRTSIGRHLPQIG